MARPVAGPRRLIVSLAHATLAIAGLSVVVGCTNPDSVTGFEEPDTAARMRAIHAAAATNDTSKIPALIERLSSGDPAERFLAIHTLERLTGTTNGFDHAGSAVERAQGIQRWREWQLNQRKSEQPVPHQPSTPASSGGQSR